jgi:valyl-tRNA synthetase
MAGAAAALAVIAGETEALVHRPETAAGETTELEQARLARELAEAEGHLAAARARLANESFTRKAPPAVVEGARAREAGLAEQVGRLRQRIGVTMES